MISFEYEGKTIEVREPTSQDQIESRLLTGGVFRRATELETPPPARDNLGQYLIKIGKWNDKKEARLKELTKSIESGKKQLARGGKTESGEPFTKAQAKELAIQMMKDRNEWMSLVLELRSYDHLSLEGIVEEAGFNCLVYRCSYSEGKRLYSSYEDYLEKQNSELAFKCAEALNKILYGEVKDDNPEVNFLKKYKFMDDEGNFVREDGKYIDHEGRLVDKDGRYIDEDGNFINRGGERVSESGDVIIEFTEYSE